MFLSFSIWYPLYRIQCLLNFLMCLQVIYGYCHGSPAAFSGKETIKKHEACPVIISKLYAAPNWRVLLVCSFLSGSHQTLQCLEIQSLTGGVKQISLWLKARKTSVVDKASNVCSLADSLSDIFLYPVSLYAMCRVLTTMGLRPFQKFHLLSGVVSGVHFHFQALFKYLIITHAQMPTVSISFCKMLKQIRSLLTVCVCCWSCSNTNEHYWQKNLQGKGLSLSRTDICYLKSYRIHFQSILLLLSSIRVGTVQTKLSIVLGSI